MRRILFSRRGVTLPELMMVVVIMAVAGAMAFPSMRSGYILRHKALAYDSLKILSDAFRKYDQEFDADILNEAGDLQVKLQEIEDKGLIQIEELYQKGQCYSVSSVLSEFKIEIRPLQGGLCSTGGVVYEHGFKMQDGRAGQWLRYQTCNSDGSVCSSGTKLTYEAHPEGF